MWEGHERAEPFFLHIIQQCDYTPNLFVYDTMNIVIPAIEDLVEPQKLFPALFRHMQQPRPNHLLQIVHGSIMRHVIFLFGIVVSFTLGQMSEEVGAYCAPISGSAHVFLLDFL